MHPARPAAALALILHCTACTDDGVVDGPTQTVGWSVDAEVPNRILRGTWAAEPDRAYAVGGFWYEESEEGVPFALRFDGASWHPEEMPEGAPALEAVWGFGDAVWAVGRGGRGLIRSGGVWTLTGLGVEVPMRALWGSRADDLWAAGGETDEGTPVLIHNDGVRWTAAELPALPPEVHTLYGLWGTNATDVWAVGQVGTILHWDGTAWSLADAGVLEDLYAVSGSNARDVVAVGGSETAVVARFDGTQWVSEQRRLPRLTGVWTDRDGYSTIVGEAGTLVELDAGETRPESPEDPGTDLDLNGIFGLPSDHRFVAGGETYGEPPRTDGVVLFHVPAPDPNDDGREG